MSRRAPDHLSCGFRQETFLLSSDTMPSTVNYSSPRDKLCTRACIYCFKHVIYLHILYVTHNPVVTHHTGYAAYTTYQPTAHPSYKYHQVAMRQTLSLLRTYRRNLIELENGGSTMYVGAFTWPYYNRDLRVVMVNNDNGYAHITFQ